MRHGLFLSGSALAVSLSIACGGTVTPTSGTDGGSDAGDGSSPADAGGDPATKSCDELVAAINAARPKASECCPTCRSLQCTQTVQDLCCPFSATTADPTFVALVAEHKKRCPGYPCPEILCKATPSNQCEPSGGSATSGTCK